MKKRGLSPIIATALLISIVMVLGAIIFLWMRGMTEEAITKFDNQNIKLVCEEVNFEAEFNAGKVYISNTGNVPIYRMKVRISFDGGYSTETLEDNWPIRGLTQGGIYSGQIITSGNSLILIPVLVGTTSEGDKTYTCDERHGLELTM